MKLGVKVIGAEEFARELKKKSDVREPIKRVVKHHGGKLQEVMQRNAVFVKGYSQGNTQQSIGYDIVQGGYGVEVGPTTEYSPYLEYGTRYMEAQPFVVKSLEEQAPKFQADLEKILDK